MRKLIGIMFLCVLLNGCSKYKGEEEFGVCPPCHEPTEEGECPECLEVDEEKEVSQGNTTFEANANYQFNGMTYTVQNGDTLKGIAAMLGLTVEQLKNWNNLTDSNKIFVGQVLNITNSISDDNSVSGSNQSQNNSESHIPYPIFKSIKNEKLVNQIILDYVNELKSPNDGQIAPLIDYQIMFQSEHYISILYSGEIVGVGYPRLFKSTLNIDVTQGSRVALNQIVNVNDDLIKLVTDSLHQEFIALGLEMETALATPWDIEDKLNRADLDNLADVESYFTKDEVVIIFGVLHALGDYIEVSIPIDQIETSIQ